MSKNKKGKRADDSKVLIVCANGHLGHVADQTALENN